MVNLTGCVNWSGQILQSVAGNEYQMGILPLLLLPALDYKISLLGILYLGGNLCFLLVSEQWLQNQIIQK